MDELLRLAEKTAYDEVQETGMPVKQHVDVSREKAIELAKEMQANIKIVEIGTLLMDCMIGEAAKAGKIDQHIEMSLEKTNELLDMINISEDDKKNIRHCVKEHHGVSNFYSLESEICCNADCYRFTSIKGFVLGIRYLRDMPFKDLITLLDKKADEKWKVISIDSVKQELSPQYQAIKEITGSLLS